MYRSQDVQSILGCAARISLHIAEAHHSTAQHIDLLSSPVWIATGISHNRFSRNCHALDAHVGVQSSLLTSTLTIPHSGFRYANLGTEHPVSIRI